MQHSNSVLLNAESEDYTGTGHPVNIKLTAVSDMACLNVTLVDDTSFEFSENLTASISGSDPSVTFDPKELTVTILDDDGMHNYVCVNWPKIKKFMLFQAKIYQSLTKMATFHILCLYA